MRLIATIAEEKQALAFRALLIHEGIENVCEASVPPGEQNLVFYIWVANEDMLEKALKLYEQFQKDPAIAPKEMPLQEEPPQEDAQPEEAPPQMAMRVRGFYRFPAPLTKLTILLCALVFICNGFLKYSLAKEHPAYAKFFGYTAIDIAFVYDYTTMMEKFGAFLMANPDINEENYKEMPAEKRIELTRIERTPHFQGLYNYFLGSQVALEGPMFEKIRTGQIWRLFTPAILHAGFLHILFNMLWLWLLGRFVEHNIKAMRYILLMVIIAIVSNTCQYLVSGPSFMGYSGVVSGLAGFIFIRQKCAPWESYPLPKATLIFLAVFIFGMAFLQLVSFFLQKFAIASFPIQVANTAHVAGAVTGMALAKIKTFEAR